jgi:hypothetical protein
MSRLIRNTAILAKIEATYNTDPTPTGGANAILVSNASFDINYTNVPRELIRGYLGSSEHLVGTRSVDIGFDVEMSGSGDAGLTAPAWAPLLKACGFAETDAGAYFEYVPLSDTFPSLTIYYYDDGALHKATGCRGNCDFKWPLGGKPVMSFKFVGIDAGTTAAANPALTLTAFQRPVAITNPNAGDILVGPTYSAGALSGGTAYPSQGLSVGMGNSVQYTPLLGGESVDIVAREAGGNANLELTAAQEVTFRTDIDANTLTSLGFSYGTVSGNIIVAYMPAVQRVNPKLTELNGRRLIGMDLRLLPSAGNDEIKIVVT